MKRGLALLGEWTKRVCVVWMSDQNGWLGVVDLVPNLALGLRERQRHGDASRPPDTPLDGNILEPSGHEKHDTSALEVIHAAQQLRRRTPRRREQVAVGERPLRRNDRPSRGEGLGSLDDWNGHGESALYQSGRWIRIVG